MKDYKNKWFSKHELSLLGVNSIRSAWDKVGNRRSSQIANVSLGNPSDQPPSKLYQYIKELMEEPTIPQLFSYMDNAGYEETRLAVANDLMTTGLFPKGLDENSIVMTCGASGAFNCVFKAILNPLDEVIILSPYFVDFPNYVSNFNAIPKIVPLSGPEFDLDIDRIEAAITSKTKAIIVNTPNNPTGKVYSDEKIRALIELLNKKNIELDHPIFLLSDEVYREIIYNSLPHTSPCSYYPYSIMIYSFSKSLSIPGERIGYVAIHPNMEHKEELFQLIKLANRFLGFTNAPALVQRIIPKLLPLKLNLEEYYYKREILSSVLENCGFEFQKPQGAFYFFVKRPIDKDTFFKLSLDNNLIVVNSNPFGYEGYFRIAYCVDIDTVRLACRKIKKISQQISTIGS